MSARDFLQTPIYLGSRGSNRRHCLHTLWPRVSIIDILGAAEYGLHLAVPGIRRVDGVRAGRNEPLRLVRSRASCCRAHKQSCMVGLMSGTDGGGGHNVGCTNAMWEFPKQGPP